MLVRWGREVVAWLDGPEAFTNPERNLDAPIASDFLEPVGAVVAVVAGADPTAATSSAPSCGISHSVVFDTYSGESPSGGCPRSIYCCHVDFLSPEPHWRGEQISGYERNRREAQTISSAGLIFQFPGRHETTKRKDNHPPSNYLMILDPKSPQAYSPASSSTP